MVAAAATRRRAACFLLPVPAYLLHSSRTKRPKDTALPHCSNVEEAPLTVSSCIACSRACTSCIFLGTDALPASRQIYTTSIPCRSLSCDPVSARWLPAPARQTMRRHKHSTTLSATWAEAPRAGCTRPTPAQCPQLQSALVSVCLLPHPLLKRRVGEGGHARTLLLCRRQTHRLRNPPSSLRPRGNPPRLRLHLTSPTY